MLLSFSIIYIRWKFNFSLFHNIAKRRQIKTLFNSVFLINANKLWCAKILLETSSIAQDDKIKPVDDMYALLRNTIAMQKGDCVLYFD